MRTHRILYAGLGLATILALPACSFTHGAPLLNFDPGQPPRNNVVFCDIEEMGTGFDNTSRVCADAQTASQTLPLTNAAIALNTGQMPGNTALDKSPAAVGRCGSNGEIVVFHGPWPQGSAECLNCGQVSPNSSAACQAVCEDLLSTSSTPPTGDVGAFCASHAHASTNVPAAGCSVNFGNACTDAGTLLANYEPFNDPRINPEPVAWTQLTGTSAGANGDLTMTAPTDSGGAFTAQAVSQQTVTGGDAFVELAAGETTGTHVIGFQTNPPATDMDPTPNDIDFALRLGLPPASGMPGLVFVSHLGTLVNGTGLNGSVQTYQPGDRFRITLTDLNNGSFTVQYAKVIGTCTPGLPCNLQPFYTDTITGTYPVRLDTSFRDQGAQLLNVTLVWIQPQ